MKTTLMITAAAFGLMLAGGAQAQVLGGVGGGIGGNVGGSVSGGLGNMGVRDTLGSARDLTRDTVRDARDTVRDTRDNAAGASLTSDSLGGLALDRNGVEADFSGSLGADVMSRGGESLGRAVGMAQDAASGARIVLVQAADGAVRGVQTSELEVTGSGSLESNLTAYNFRRLPEQAAPAAATAASPTETETPDDTRQSPNQTDVDRVN